MLDWIWKTLLDLVKDKPLWKASQPALFWAMLLLGATAIGFQYVQWRYDLKLGWQLYLHSYLFKQVLVVYSGIALSCSLLAWGTTAQPDPTAAGLSVRLVRWASAHYGRLTAVIAVLACCTIIAVKLEPATPINRIQVRFDQAQRTGSFDRDAVVYLLYEFNRIQKSWHFEVHFDPVSMPDAELWRHLR